VLVQVVESVRVVNLSVRVDFILVSFKFECENKKRSAI
jgi:hypothetical protein